MKLYVAICCDRHTDECVRVFSTPEKAIAFCKKFMEECAKFPEDIEEKPVKGWLFHATYSQQGDKVRVEETELDNED